jgi:hypothetical protein
MNIGMVAIIEISGTEFEPCEAVGVAVDAAEVAVAVGRFEVGEDVGLTAGLLLGVGEDPCEGEELGETAVEVAINVALLQGTFTPTLSVLLVRMLAPERLI